MKANASGKNNFNLYLFGLFSVFLTAKTLFGTKPNTTLSLV
jgi:hypothetical protein